MLSRTELTAISQREQPPLRRRSKSQLAGTKCPNASLIKSQLAGIIANRPNASYSLLRAHVGSQAFKYTRVQLRTVATLRAAELQASRKIQAPELELRIFKLVASANGLVTGWRKSRQLGLIQFLAEAGKSNGSVYTYAWAFRRSWGVDPEATPARHLQDIEALNSFPPHHTSDSLGNRNLPGFACWDSNRLVLGVDH